MNNDKLSLAVEALTPEQKDNMSKIYKKYIISLVSVVLVAIIVGLSLFIYFHSESEKAKDKYDALMTSNQIGYGNILSNSSELRELSDRYFDMKDMQTLSFGIAGAICVIGSVATYFIFKQKYPYFSEKKYAYLKKANKQNTAN